MDLSVIIELVGGVVIAIMGYLFSKKDAAQESQLEDLYIKHEADAAKLQSLEIKIAENHYPKSEINQIVDSLKKYLDDRFDRIEKMGRLS
jgi:hypothetical protein